MNLLERSQNKSIFQWRGYNENKNLSEKGDTTSTLVDCKYIDNT